MTDHHHRWESTTHWDGCHFYEWGYVCECGTTCVHGAERDNRVDPWTAIWLSDDCERCRELQAGATPRSWRIERDPDGRETRYGDPPEALS